MKKVFSVLLLLFSVGISSLFLLGSCDRKISMFFQRFMGEKSPSVPLVLVSADDSFFEELGSSRIDSSVVDSAVLCAKELGALGTLSDFGYKNALRDIDFLAEKNERIPQKEKSIFNIKIVFPTKRNPSADVKTTEISSKLLPFLHPSFSGEALFAGDISKNDDFPFSKQLVFRKNGKYYARLGFASLLEQLSPQKVQVTNSSLILKKITLPNGKEIDSLKIPRAANGSVLLKFPKKSWRNYKFVSISDFYELSRAESKLYSYLRVMAERGFFGELNSDTPLEVFESALSSKNDFPAYLSWKRHFYMLMSAFLSGNQEKLLCDSASEDNLSVIKSTFADCRTLFNDIETKRARLADSVRGTFCAFALVADSTVDFAPAPSDLAYPETLSSFLLANMIFSGDFVSELSPVFSVLIAFIFALLFVIFAWRIKKPFLMILFSVMMVFLAFLSLACAFLLFHIFAGFCVPVSSLLILSVFFNVLCFKKISEKRTLLKNSFMQCVSSSFVDEVFSSRPACQLDGVDSGASVMATSIQNFKSLRQLLKGSQFFAFLNYYFENVSREIVRFGGLVESYRNDEMISLFGSPLHSEKHSESVVKAAFAIKSADISMNEDILRYPRSPKPDGMSDDLYTAFFILNHNGKKISTRIGIYASSVLAGCLGSDSKKSFRIADDSWKNALAVRDAAKKYGSAGILMNEIAEEAVHDECIIRRLGSFYDIPGERVYLSEVLGDRQDDDEKLWNYANYWNNAVDFMEKNEPNKALMMFKKLSEGRPNDKVARYFINLLGGVE